MNVLLVSLGAIVGAAAMRLWCDRARVIFEGGAHGTGQIRSCLFYFGPRRFLFAHVFEAIGEITVYDRRKAA
jgi:hypothetical protein